MRVLLALSLLLLGCAADGDPWGAGAPLAGMTLDVQTVNEGVYPDQSVLVDPGNPFAQGAINDTTIWEIQSKGGAVAGFYAWATACARGATGERQYYAALDLKAIYELNQAVADDMPLVRDLAIRGFQAVLDHFPDAVTWDATGTIAYDLATPSVESILQLGGKVEGGWVLVQTDGGGKKAVRP
jgi:hypothetical protein